jgi:hypothetical protein
MTKVNIGSDLMARLGGLGDLVEFCDEAGRTLGYFHPVVDSGTAEATDFECPFSRAELERRRGQRTGRPLKDILEDLRDK